MPSDQTSHAAHILSNNDLSVSLSVANTVEVSSRTKGRPTRMPHNKGHFIPAFPLRVQLALLDARAGTVLPLVLAIHRQLTMSGREETPLNGAIWDAAGRPSPKQRETILRKLKALPEIIEIIPGRTWTTHYRVRRGAVWSA
jgi:hypothetical protein